ncbi:MAG: helix-turn-helix domain-containing protein [Solirubrobacterales bacterium]
MSANRTSASARRPGRSRRDRHASRRERRRARERAIVATTRALFDERGRRDAPVDEIARTAGINKALIYRAFDSKEELFVLTVTDYLADLEERCARLMDTEDPADTLRGCLDAYAAFCLEYPAFLDCSLALMQRPAEELRELVSGAVWLRLGRRMATCLGRLEAILERGRETGAFAIGEEADFVANRIYAQILGTMHLARVGVGLREAAPGVPQTFELDPNRVRALCVEDALMLARPTGSAGEGL